MINKKNWELMKEGITINKDLFVESINALKHQAKHDNKCADAFEVILPDSSLAYYANHFVTNQLLKLLQVAMNDANKDSWIEYYIYELDFGNKYKEGCVTDKDKKSIKLKTEEDLWNLLTK